MVLINPGGNGECAGTPWQYGVRSPDPRRSGQKIYGGFITVRTPPSLPSLDCLTVIWVSVSSKKWFYQTSLGYHPSWGWHVSAGACCCNEDLCDSNSHPQLPANCGCACPPLKLNGVKFTPKPNSLYDLGVRFVPQENGINKVYLYLFDHETSTRYNIYILEDEDDASTPVGGILESYSTDKNELSKLDSRNPLMIQNVSWFTEEWGQILWPHAFVYEGGDYKNVPEDVWDNIEIKPFLPGRLYIGYKVDGTHYPTNYQLW